MQGFFASGVLMTGIQHVTWSPRWEWSNCEMIWEFLSFSFIFKRQQRDESLTWVRFFSFIQSLFKQQQLETVFSVYTSFCQSCILDPREFVWTVVRKIQRQVSKILQAKGAVNSSILEHMPFQKLLGFLLLWGQLLWTRTKQGPEWDFVPPPPTYHTQPPGLSSGCGHVPVVIFYVFSILIEVVPQRVSHIWASTPEPDYYESFDTWSLAMPLSLGKVRRFAQFVAHGRWWIKQAQRNEGLWLVSLPVAWSKWELQQRTTDGETQSFLPTKHLNTESLVHHITIKKLLYPQAKLQDWSSDWTLVSANMCPEAQKKYSLFQIGQAVVSDSSLRRVVDLGDLSAHSCILAPRTCGTDGGSVALWFHVLDGCSDFGGGLITSRLNAGEGLNMRKRHGEFMYIFSIFAQNSWINEQQFCRGQFLERLRLGSEQICQGHLCVVWIPYKFETTRK